MKFKIIMIFVVFLGLFWLLNVLLAPKYQISLVEGHMIKEYYNEDKNHEVIFIGDCEVYANFSPLEMYEKYGITSYIRGTSQQLIWQSYEILKETLKYEKPKVIVFNVNAMRYDKPVSEAYNRLTLDGMKWSKEKISTIKSSMLDEESFISYIFPILRYHSRFSSLSKEDFEYLFKEKNVTFNGFLINKNIKPYVSLPTKKPLANYDFKENVYDYLNKMLLLCKENNIELVLIKAPSLYPYWYDEYENQIIDYSSKNGVDYYNFINLIQEIGIDYNVDTYDGGLHLNLTGAVKLSNYFGKILKENYNLTDFRTSEINDIYQEKLLLYNNAKEVK